MSPHSTHDTTRTDDTRIGAVRPLITPALLEERLGAQLLLRSTRSFAVTELGKSGAFTALGIEPVTESTEQFRKFIHVVRAVSSDIIDADIEHVCAFANLIFRHLHARVEISIE